MAVQTGERVGRYEILGPIGAGGMGEVWKARDTRLDRVVAIKFAQDRFSDRFESEALAIARLNHSNICQLYDVGPNYLVMEFVAGQPLKGPLPLQQALLYGAQICDALDAAHRNGIIHRDLKPSNILVSKGGLKLLDFGLAKLARAASPQGDVPTLAMTEENSVLGTLQYMAPEQLQAKTADARSDIFSFGCVLYELLTGTPAFKAENRAQIATAILRDDPPELSAAVPAPVKRVLSKCLMKEPESRWQSAADLADELRWLAKTPIETEQKTSARQRTRSKAVLLLTLAAGLVGGAIGAVWLWPRNAAGTSIPHYLTYSGRDSSPAFSPDGRTIAFASDRDGRSRIWLKQMAGGSEVPLTSGPDDNPRFSPDGSMVLFSRNEGPHTSLYRISTVGGDARKVIDDVVSGDFSPDGRRIAFVRWKSGSTRETSVLGVADVDGSQPTEIVRLQAFLLDLPRWSPNGKQIAVNASAQGGFRDRIMIFDTDGKNPRTLSPPLLSTGMSSVTWVSNTELIYIDGDRYQAVPPVLVRQNVRTAVSRSRPWPRVSLIVDVTNTGHLVFDTQSDRSGLRELALNTRQVMPGSRWVARGNSVDRQPAYSPDGKRIAFTSNRSGGTDIWQISTGSGALTRLTDAPGSDSDPAFTPDGKGLVWTSDRRGYFEIYTGAADGTGARQVTHDGRDAENPTMTADGKWIVYSSTHPEKVGIWKIHPDGSAATRMTSAGYNPEVSPDGQYALFVTTVRSDQNAIRVVRIADGREVPFEISCPIHKQTGLVIGRGRWMPNGKAIAFVGQDENGTSGIYVQDFAIGKDTSGSRYALGGFDPEIATETFGISPDGKHVMISSWEQVFSIMIADQTRSN